MSDQGIAILGGGVSGLAAGSVLGCPVFEAAAEPGGICSSYYLTEGGQRPEDAQARREAYRFEIGGGHWIFGGDPLVLDFLRGCATLRSYHRSSAVFFPESQRFVDYPLQNHLHQLDRALAARALTEICQAPRGVPETMARWLEQCFGRTLVQLFFGPFHQLYTAGLWTEIAPQDAFKSPVDLRQVIRGTLGSSDAVGYNVTFVYPEAGLDRLTAALAERCDIRYERRVVAVDTARREIAFADGSSVGYERLLSTLPLDRMLQLCGIELEQPADPHTAVLVLNIGAVRGERCPDHHWLYLPQSEAGFHRVGFYSNVDRSFLPAAARERNDRVSIYVERAFAPGARPTAAEQAAYGATVVAELQRWGFIGEVEVLDPTWIDVAYTWAYPGSSWKAAALGALDQHGIRMVGRYGRWIFQGIADSVRDGLMAGAALRGAS